MISEAFNPSHSRSFGTMLQWGRRAVLWRRRSGIWEESLSGQVKVQWLTLCYSSLRPECWDCDGQQHDIHISHVSPENANYGRNQLQTLQIPALKKWKNSDKQAMTVTSLTNNTPPGAKLHTKFVACEIKKKSLHIVHFHCTFSLHIAHFHCKLLHWRMKLEGTNAKYWLRRNTSRQQQQIQLNCKPPERWPNRGRRVRRLSWNYVWRKFLSNWLKLGLHA